MCVINMRIVLGKFLADLYNKQHLWMVSTYIFEGLHRSVFFSVFAHIFLYYRWKDWFLLQGVWNTSSPPRWVNGFWFPNVSAVVLQKTVISKEYWVGCIAYISTLKIIVPQSKYLGCHGTSSVFHIQREFKIELDCSRSNFTPFKNLS